MGFDPHPHVTDKNEKLNNHLEKYEFVNGKDDIPYIVENKTCLKPPTR